ncbi:MAG TPA: hypothetical protein VD866_01825, partial [Urbifossiella sp.]|nr:hypothetical protein [Urbifossiella sp.]
RRRARFGELRNDLLRLAPELLPTGESVDLAEIVRRLQERVAYQDHRVSVKYVLDTYSDLFSKVTEPLTSRSHKSRYTLRPH